MTSVENIPALRHLARTEQQRGATPAVVFERCFGSPHWEAFCALEETWEESALPFFGELLWPWRLWGAQTTLDTRPHHRLSEEALDALICANPDFIPALRFRVDLPITPERLFAFRVDDLDAPDGPQLWELSRHAEGEHRALGGGLLAGFRVLLEELREAYDNQARRNHRQPDEEAAVSRNDLDEVLATLEELLREPEEP